VGDVLEAIDTPRDAAEAARPDHHGRAAPLLDDGRPLVPAKGAFDLCRVPGEVGVGGQVVVGVVAASAHVDHHWLGWGRGGRVAHWLAWVAHRRLTVARLRTVAWLRVSHWLTVHPCLIIFDPISQSYTFYNFIYLV
jgi:hypothetical protein